MEQVAHQTIVMQFILELAKSLKVDPRGCFRQFFEKIKVTTWMFDQKYVKNQSEKATVYLYFLKKEKHFKFFA